MIVTPADDPDAPPVVNGPRRYSVSMTTARRSDPVEETVVGEFVDVVMVKTQKASPDGVTVVTYVAGESYAVPGELGETMLREGWATLKTAAPVAPAKTKPAPDPAKKKAKPKPSKGKSKG